MQITFRSRSIEQPITAQELDDFENLIGKTLPSNYRQHMLTINGGVVNQLNNAHINFPETGSGIADFYPLKYGGYIMERAHEQITNRLPNGYIAIGRTRGGGNVIISLNNDSTYGNVKEWYPDGEINNLSSFFTQLLNDQVEIEDY